MVWPVPYSEDDEARGRWKGPTPDDSDDYDDDDNDDIGGCSLAMQWSWLYICDMS